LIIDSPFTTPITCFKYIEVLISGQFKAFIKGIGRAKPLVSIKIASISECDFNKVLIAGMKSS